MSARWCAGNRIRLLENGEAYYPRVFEAIAQARSEVLVETFILFADKVGYTQKKAMDRLDAKKEERRQRALEALGRGDANRKR